MTVPSATVARMEAEMRGAAKELEFERAAALRDEIQQIRLRVLDQDQSAIIARAAELAAQRAPARSGRGASSRAWQPVGAAVRGGGTAGGAEAEAALALE
jgi:excinuclease UvrABC nuclease subunit